MSFRIFEPINDDVCSADEKYSKMKNDHRYAEPYWGVWPFFKFFISFFGVCFLCNRTKSFGEMTLYVEMAHVTQPAIGVLVTNSGSMAWRFYAVIERSDSAQTHHGFSDQCRLWVDTAHHKHYPFYRPYMVFEWAKSGIFFSSIDIFLLPGPMCRLIFFSGSSTWILRRNNL